MFLKKLYSKIGSKLQRLEDFYQFKRFKNDSIFNVKIDDTEFLMQFGDNPINGYKAQRVRGIYEPETSAVIKSIVRPGDKVLELGGCYGYFTLLLSKCSGEKGEVITIEGTPLNYQLLKNNILINRCKNVRAFNVFLTNRTEKVSFKKTEKDPYEAIKRISSEVDKLTKNYLEVEVYDLSDFLKTNSFDPNHIFMDIEGFEVDCIESLTKGYLNFNKPNIIFEQHPMFYKKEKDLKYILEILEKKGYYFRRVAQNVICLPRF